MGAQRNRQLRTSVGPGECFRGSGIESLWKSYPVGWFWWKTETWQRGQPVQTQENARNPQCLGTQKQLGMVESEELCVCGGGVELKAQAGK